MFNAISWADLNSLHLKLAMLTAKEGMPSSVPSKAAATVPEQNISVPKFGPWFIPDSIRSGLAQYANNSLYDSGRAEWPTNPFDALSEKPAGYSTDPTDADVDGEWTFSNDRITHQRADNSRFEWAYDPGTQGGGDDAKIGTLGQRTEIQGPE